MKVQERCIESMNAHLCVFARVLTSSPPLEYLFSFRAALTQSVGSLEENLSLSPPFSLIALLCGTDHIHFSDLNAKIWYW